jgi:hypothetical protein
MIERPNGQSGVQRGIWWTPDQWAAIEQLMELMGLKYPDLLRHAMRQVAATHQVAWPPPVVYRVPREESA